MSSFERDDRIKENLLEQPWPGWPGHSSWDQQDGQDQQYLQLFWWQCFGRISCCCSLKGEWRTALFISISLVSCNLQMGVQTKIQLTFLGGPPEWKWGLRISFAKASKSTLSVFRTEVIGVIRWIQRPLFFSGWAWASAQSLWTICTGSMDLSKRMKTTATV